MEKKNVALSNDECEDIRFALGQLAQDDENKAGACRGTDLERALLEQAERFRALARKVTS